MEPEAPPPKPKSQRKPRAPGSKSRSVPADDGPVPAPGAPAAERPDCLPWAPALVFNLLIAAALTLVATLLLDRLGLADLPEKIGLALFCVPPQISMVGGALVLTAVWQLVWRYLGEAVSPVAGPARIGCIRIPFRVLVPLCRRLHFCRLPTPWLWVATGASLLLAWTCLGPHSPFRSSEMPPRVESFLVSTDGGAEVLIGPGGTAEARSGGSLWVTAKVQGPKDARCVWSAGRGRIATASGCMAVYVTPLDGAIDSLSIRVRSTCRTQDAFAGLTIQLTPY